MTAETFIREKPVLDEKAFNEAFEQNKLYKPDIDHHWLYTFVCYYESAKQSKQHKSEWSGE